MLGWFRKTASQDVRNRLEIQARQTLVHIAGQIDDTHFCTARGRINFADVRERQQLREAFGTVWQQLSKNRENWPAQLNEFSQESQKGHASKYHQAATLLLTGIVKTDAICRIALEFPDDSVIRSSATRVLTGNFSAFDFIMTAGAPASFGDPTPSTELLSELQYANAFFEKIVFE